VAGGLGQILSDLIFLISATLRHHTKYTRYAVTRLHGISETQHASFPNKSSVIHNELHAARSFFKIWHSLTCSRPFFLVCNFKFIILPKNHFIAPNHTNAVWKRLPLSEIEVVLPDKNYWLCGELCFPYLRRNIYFSLTHHI